MKIYTPDNPNWEERDLPVLRGAVELIERHQGPTEPHQISLHIGMTTKHVQAALRALAEENPPFFNDIQTAASGEIWFVDRPTGHARRAVNLWPRPEEQVEQLVKALSLAADRENDPETKGALRRAGAYLGNAGRDVLVGILTNAVTGG